MRVNGLAVLVVLVLAAFAAPTDALGPPPTTPAFFSPAEGAKVNTASVRFKWAPVTSAAGFTRYDLITDGGTKYVIHPQDSEQEVFFPSDGTHTATVTVADSDGQTASDTRTIVVDTVAPGGAAVTAPADKATVTTARPTLTWSAGSDAGTGIDHYTVVLDGGHYFDVAGTALSFTPSALADGDHTWAVATYDGVGNVAAGVTRTFTVDTRPPVAAITTSAGPSTADTDVTFSAAGSLARQGTLTYAWDLDGNGTFEISTGATPSVTHAFSTPGDYQVRVLVTDTAGRADSASLHEKVTPAVVPGGPGVSINGGDAYTDDPDVTLTIHWPAFSTQMRIGNDGGFSGIDDGPLRTSVPWTLVTTGAERLPKTVYVQFDGLGGPAEYELPGVSSFQDDIILDQTAPTLRSLAARRVKNGVRLRVVAKDATSGVDGVQITKNRKKPGAWRAAARTYRLKRKSNAALFVRARDKAGNTSRFKRAVVKPRRR